MTYCQASSQNQTFVDTSKKLLKIEIKIFPLCIISREN